MRLAGSYFPHQGSNPWPLQWKCRALTTGPSGNPPQELFGFIISFDLLPKHYKVEVN